MQQELTHQAALRQIGKAHCLVKVMTAEDVKGNGPAGLRLVDQDPARGRVVVNNLDTVSAMIRGSDGAVVQQFGHAKITGKLEYDSDTGAPTRLDVSVTGQEGQGVENFGLFRQSDGTTRYQWSGDGHHEMVVLEKEGELYAPGSSQPLSVR